MNSKQINRLLAVCIKPKTKLSCDIKICADHQLPETLPDKHMFFTNVDNEHWVLLFKENDVIEYFDSTGERSSVAIAIRLQTTDFISNGFVFQKDSTDLNCGLYCVMYAFCKLVKCLTMKQSVAVIRDARSSKIFFYLCQSVSELHAT